MRAFLCACLVAAASTASAQTYSQYRMYQNQYQGAAAYYGSMGMGYSAPAYGYYAPSYAPSYEAPAYAKGSYAPPPTDWNLYWSLHRLNSSLQELGFQAELDRRQRQWESDERPLRTRRRR